MIPKFLKPVLLNKRLPPLLTLLLGPVVFALSLVAVLSRGDNNLEQHFVVKLNTSTLLQNVIKVVPASSVTARAIDPTITSAPSLDERQLFPSPDEVGSFFNSVGSKISTAILPVATGAVGGGLTGGNGGTGGLGDILNGNGSVTDFFSSGPIGNLFNTIGGQAATGVVGVVNSLAAGAANGLGFSDQYSLYLRHYCTANMTGGTQNLGPQRCTALRDISIDPSNSTLQVGNVLVDFSAINIPNKLSGANEFITTLFDAIFAFQIIGIVSSGLLLVLAPLLIFSIFQFSFLRAIAGVLAQISAVFLSVVAAIEIAIGVVAPTLINHLGDGLGVSARRGSGFLAIVGVAAGLMGLLAGIWSVHLIGSYHSRTYVRIDDDLVISAPKQSGSRRFKRPIIRLNKTEDRLPEEKLYRRGESDSVERSETSNRSERSGVRPRQMEIPQYRPYRPPGWNDNRMTVG